MAHNAGITVKMITGDHALTGLAIGKMLGIAGNDTVTTGPEIDAMTDERLAEVCGGGLWCGVERERTTLEDEVRSFYCLKMFLTT